jgi:hypothetical protein
MKKILAAFLELIVELILFILVLAFAINGLYTESLFAAVFWVAMTRALS